MRVLVTGATGFIGRHSIPLLEARGHSLTLAVRDEDSQKRLPQSNPGAGRRVVTVGEIDESTDWREALQDVDAVVHLAARAHILDADSQDDQAFRRVNVEGTDNLAAQAVDAGARRFVLMSSIGAVATSSDACITLDTPCTPDTPYGRSKLAGEQALIERTAGSQTRWTILRPTLVYGPGNPGNMARLVALVLRGAPLPFGALQNRRSLVFVGNLVDLTERVLSHPGAHDAAFLVADGEDLSTPDLIRRIAQHAGIRAHLFPVPSALLHGLARLADGWTAATGAALPFGTPALRRLESSLYVDIRPLRATLDWAPPFGVDEGLRCMLTPK